MSILPNIGKEVIQLLQEVDFIWDNLSKAFIEAREPERESTDEYKNRSKRSISYEELRDHGLVGTVSEADHERGLAWLRHKLGLNGSLAT